MELDKYTFKHEHEGGEIQVTTSEVVLDDILREFKGFLLAVGFHPKSVDEYLKLDE